MVLLAIAGPDFTTLFVLRGGVVEGGGKQKCNGLLSWEVVPKNKKTLTVRTVNA